MLPGAAAAAARGRVSVTIKFEEDYDCDFTSVSVGFVTGVIDRTAPGGSVNRIHVTGRSGFGARCNSSNIFSTRAARYSSVLKYSIGRA